MRDARIELDWADDTYSFRLGWGELAALQEECDAGPYFILGRLQDGSWKLSDISSVIRLGLRGGGSSPADALKLVRLHVEARPPLENLLHAKAILVAGLMGAPDEPVGENAAPDSEGEGSTTSPTEKSGSEPSTEPEPSSASRRRRSTP